MSDEMGTFRIDVELENPARPGRRQVVKGALVDTGSELSWVNVNLRVDPISKTLVDAGPAPAAAAR